MEERRGLLITICIYIYLHVYLDVKSTGITRLVEISESFAKTCISQSLQFLLINFIAYSKILIQ